MRETNATLRGLKTHQTRYVNLPISQVFDEGMKTVLSSAGLFDLCLGSRPWMRASRTHIGTNIPFARWGLGWDLCRGHKSGLPGSLEDGSKVGLSKGTLAGTLGGFK